MTASAPAPLDHSAPDDADRDATPGNDAGVAAHDGCSGACAAYSRRTVLRGAGAVTLGAAATLLAACAPSTSGSSTAGAGSTGAAATSGGSTAAGGAVALAKLADVPVGGALGVQGADGTPIILSQPVAGTVVGMSAVCTHAGCTVAPDGSELVCPCHGSIYRAADGSNVSGPAPKPLPAVAVRVEGDSIFAA
ncbi:(2Fe-2S)-binding protein [Cellulomonas sp. WB94]|nr:(2Fe-2S)-binding protein [Cellulomonas sp. WB94]